MFRFAIYYKYISDDAVCMEIEAKLKLFLFVFLNSVTKAKHYVTYARPQMLKSQSLTVFAARKTENDPEL